MTLSVDNFVRAHVVIAFEETEILFSKKTNPEFSSRISSSSEYLKQTISPSLTEKADQDRKNNFNEEKNN